MYSLHLNFWLDERQCKMESGDEIFLTQNTYSPENAASDYDTDSIVNDILSMEKENEAKFELDFTQSESKPENSTDNFCTEKSRFANPLSESDLNDLIRSAVPKNTERKARWAVNVFTEWTRARKIKDDLLSMDNTSLNTHLCSFITEVRNKDGNHYRPNTLYEIVVSIQHFLRQNGNFVSFLDDNDFLRMRQVLDARMKEVSKTGLGSSHKRADIISPEQESILWVKGFLDSNTPAQLLDTIVFSFGLNFALRAGQEHRNLR